MIYCNHKILAHLIEPIAVHLVHFLSEENEFVPNARIQTVTVGLMIMNVNSWVFGKRTLYLMHLWDLIWVWMSLLNVVLSKASMFHRKMSNPIWMKFPWELCWDYLILFPHHYERFAMYSEQNEPSYRVYFYRIYLTQISINARNPFPLTFCANKMRNTKITTFSTSCAQLGVQMLYNLKLKFNLIRYLSCIYPELYSTASRSPVSQPVVLLNSVLVAL